MAAYTVWLICKPRAPSYMNPNVGVGGGGGGGCCGCGVSANVCLSRANGAQINFGDLNPYLTYGPHRIYVKQKRVNISKDSEQHFRKMGHLLYWVHIALISSWETLRKRTSSCPVQHIEKCKCITFGGFIKGILRGVRCTKSLRVLLEEFCLLALYSIRYTERCLLFICAKKLFLLGITFPLNLRQHF